jgi:hypothetical protein
MLYNKSTGTYIPTAEFELYLDGELIKTAVATCRRDAGEIFDLEVEDYNTLRVDPSRYEVKVREHRCWPGAMAYICCFCQAKIEND